MKKWVVGLIIFLNTGIVLAQDFVWKVSIISAFPARSGIPSDFCLQFTPNNFAASLNQLQQNGVRADNNIVIRFRTFQPEMQNDLIFTQIEAVISKQLDSGHAWYTNMFIHLQQLSPYGVADGVWSTRECKGRLIVQPQG